MTMASVAQSLPASARPLVWFWEFLKDELAPFPGRAGTVARMVVAATLIMLVCMTLRIPFGYLGAIYALLISRENTRVTLRASAEVLLLTQVGVAYILIMASVVVNVPLLHFFWVASSFFTAFFVLSTMRSYSASVCFAFVISIGVPLWDRHEPAEINVENTLWLSLAISVGALITAGIELALTRSVPGDDIVLPVNERLETVQDLLACYAGNHPVDPATAKKIVTLCMLGTSSLRRSLRRSDYSAQYRAQMSGVVALVGRLVDITATLPQLSFEPSETDRRQLQNLVEVISVLRTELMNRRVPVSIQFSPDDESVRRTPLLHQMENMLALIPQAFAGSPIINEYLPSADDPPQSGFFVPDALVNPEHLKVALKGCLAASLCYIIYNALDWPGISTCVTTCLVTALSTVGSSRQKQVLRLAGAVAGGIFFGMGSQVLILPNLDSIGGFAILFAFVTAVAAWFMTSGPRLSYFGVQLALAFYFINLQEFTVQVSLTVARDRVVGVMLGLSVMWLVFDQLWSASAGVEMKRAFIASLRLMAQLAKEPVVSDVRVAIKQSFALREMINGNFDKVRSLADGVLFEFDPAREQHLVLRDRIREWQPELRTLFLMRIASIKYRLRLPGFELPEPVLLAQKQFDERLAGLLNGMADRLQGKARGETTRLEDSLAHLEDVVRACSPAEPSATLNARRETFLILSRRIENAAVTLDQKI